MPKFSQRSKDRIDTLVPELQELLYDAIKTVDFTVLVGFRDEEAQNAAFESGASTKRWPDSRHNTLPSFAVDIAPGNTEPTTQYVDWEDLPMFGVLAGVIYECARRRGYSVRWGGDWDGDGSTRDHKLRDFVHFEFVRKEP